MKALQLHYTSCRRGRSGSAGFQVRALTAGITPDEQREIERQGLYRPPRDCAPEPTREQIERDFPVALRGYTLESGRRALTLSRYCGRDYSGRWGNFFAHTLVFEGPADGLPWPIDYFEWPGWKGELAPDEDRDEEPGPLPAADLDGVEPAESFRLEEIAEFLREEPGREELLATMGRAVLLSRETSRAVVVRDTPLNNLYWIAALQKLFPPAHAASLSFSTYQEDPRDCADVNATAGETSFTFSDNERRYQFYQFDLVTGCHSELPAPRLDYAALAVHWMAREPGELERFFGFMALFEHSRVEPELVAAGHLFELSRGRFPTLSSADLAAMIRFADRWAVAEGRAKLMEGVAAAAERSGGFEQAADYAGVLRFLTDGARATGEPRHRQLAFATWLKLIDDHVVCQGSGLEVTEEGWRTLQRALGRHLAELAEVLLAPPRWQSWRERLPELPPEALVLLLRLTWQCLDLVDRRPAWRQSEVTALLDALVRRPGDVGERVQPVLELVSADPEALAEVVRQVAELLPSEPKRPARVAVGRALGRVLAAAPQVAAGDLRKRLDAPESWDVLFGEWLEILARAEEPERAFRRYESAVLAELAGYGRHCRGWVASSLLAHLPEARRVRCAVDWLHAGELDGLPDELVRQCLELANTVVTLDPRDRDREELAGLVADVARRKGVALHPDRPALRHALERASGASSMRELNLPGLEAALEGLPPTEYRLFLDAFLEPALAVTGTRLEHGRVLRVASRSEHRTLFLKAYRRFFRIRRKIHWDQPLYSALRFWIALSSEEDRELKWLEATAREELARALSRLSHRRYRRVEAKVRPRTEEEEARWRDLKDAVKARSSGLLGRMRNRLFGRSTA